MTFKHTCIRGDKYLTKIIFKEGEDEKWATTSKEVHDWAKRSFKDGDTVDVEYDIKNGQYFVTRISAPGQGGVKTSEKEKTTSPDRNPTCSDCGKVLKDNKYEKCFTCNQKNPKKKTIGRYNKSPEVSESIKRQAIGHMTSRSLIALQGQVDINNIQEIAESIYKMYVKLVG